VPVCSALYRAALITPPATGILFIAENGDENPSTRQAFLFHVPDIFPEGESRASERAANIQIASMRK